jgi:hypothetical protein
MSTEGTIALAKMVAKSFPERLNLIFAAMVAASLAAKSS